MITFGNSGDTLFPATNPPIIRCNSRGRRPSVSPLAGPDFVAVALGVFVRVVLLLGADVTGLI